MLNADMQNKAADGNPGLDRLDGDGQQFVEEQNRCHTLLIDVILSNVFDYVRNNDLKACRSVCRKWNVLTLPRTRSSFEISIFVYQSKPFSEHESYASTARKIESFLKVFRKNKLGIPFGDLCLGGFCATDGPGQEFLRLCEDTVKKITFFPCIFDVEDVSEIIRSTPKLEFLRVPMMLRSKSGDLVQLFPGPENSKPRLNSLKTFEIGDEFPDERIQCCPSFLEEIITVAPNISHLSLRHSDTFSENNKFYSSSLEALRLIERLGRQSRIQRMFLNIVTMEHVELLRRMTRKPNGLKLRNLFFYNLNSSEETSFNLIGLFRHTLEKLRVSHNQGFTSFTEFPKIPRLTKLDVKVSKDFNSRCVNFKSIFPSLRKLCISQHGQQEYDEFLTESESCLNMREFILDEGLMLKINAFNRIMTVFPNLTSLELYVGMDGAGILRQIWTHLKELEYLKVYGTIPMVESMDCIFTGISNDCIQEGEVSDLEKMTIEERRKMTWKLRQEYSQIPSIAHLTKMTSLYLRVTGKAGSEDTKLECCLSDRSVYLGLYSLKHLRDLTVAKCMVRLESEILNYWYSVKPDSNIRFYLETFTKNSCEILIVDLGISSWSFSNLNSEYVIPNSKD